MRNFLLAIALIFSSSLSFGQTYFLNGSAFYLGGDCYLLTPAIGTMNGTVWYADQIDLNQPFDLQFTMNFGTLDANGADGMCFVLQTVGTSAIGTSGGGMGYQDFGTSLGIEFDTYQNGDFGDPSADHIAIEYNGNINHGASTGHIAGPVQASATNVNIEDGEDHVVRITWSPETHIVEVYFDCEFRLQGETDLINDIFGGQSLVYWGFTAATGGSYNNQSVCLREDILNVSEVSVCEGASIQLDVSGSLDGEYTWTPSDYLSDPSSPSPIASPPVTTTYTATYLDICGNFTESEITVNVEELEVTLANSTVLSCLISEINLVAESNLDLDAVYTWSLNGEVVQTGNNLSVIAIDTPGTYEVEMNVDDACIDTYSIEVNANFSTYEITAGNDQALNCVTEQITIDAQTNGGNQVSWFHNSSLLPNENSLSLQVSEPGNYTVYIIHPSSGCTSDDTVTITENYSTPQISTGEQDSLTCLRPFVPIQNIIINLANDYSISWTTIGGNISVGAQTISPVVNSAADYTITVTDNTSGCSSSETVFVGQGDDFGFDVNQLVFPNVITPNGDQYNNSWRPFSGLNPDMNISNVFSQFDLKVYDRWGRIVFESTQFNKQWDAKDLGEGTYFYIFRFESYCNPGSAREIHGNVLVARS